MSKAIDIAQLTDRPGWIPAHIKDNWDTDPYAYITEDEFMSAGAFHNQLIAWFMEVLRHFLAQREQALLPDVLMLYRDEEGVRQRISPDLSLVPLSDNKTYSYNLDNRPTPRFIIELISPESMQDDTEKKVALYEHLGVQEYLAIDLADLTVSALYFWQLVSGQLRRVTLSDNSVNIQAMGVNIRLNDGVLTLVELATGQQLEDSVMLMDRTAMLMAQADIAEQQLINTQQEADTAKQEADAAKQEADAAKQEADTAKQRADTAERHADGQAREIAELRAELARLRST